MSGVPRTPWLEGTGRPTALVADSGKGVVTSKGSQAKVAVIADAIVALLGMSCGVAVTSSRPEPGGGKVKVFWPMASWIPPTVPPLAGVDRKEIEIVAIPP